MGEKKEKRVGKNDFLQPKKKKSADKDVDEQFEFFQVWGGSG